MSQPTTRDVRDAYMSNQGLKDRSGPAFDRWFAEAVRGAAERAWAEGHVAGRDYQGDGWNADAHDPADDNPYRREEA